jgi:hypothetical protein
MCLTCSNTPVCVKRFFWDFGGFVPRSSKAVGGWINYPTFFISDCLFSRVSQSALFRNNVWKKSKWMWRQIIVSEGGSTGSVNLQPVHWTQRHSFADQ